MCEFVELTREGIEAACVACPELTVRVRAARPCPRCGAPRWALTVRGREKPVPCPCVAQAHPNYAADDAALKRILDSGSWLPVRSRGRAAVERAPKTNWRPVAAKEME